MLGAINGHLGLVDEAIASCRQAIAIQPNFPAAYYNLSLALKDKGDLEGAVESCRQAIRLRPAYVEAHHTLGALLASLHRYDQAAIGFRKALSLSPSFVAAHVNLGNVLAVLKKYDEAIRSYREAIALQPDLAEAHDALGAAYFYLGKSAEAVQCHQMAIKINPNFVTAYVNQGAALVNMGALQEAVTILRIALQLQPDSLIITQVAHAHYTLGKALVDLGKYDEAIACYAQALKLGQETAETYIHLGGAYLNAGRRDEARENFRQALNLDPDSGEAAYYLASLGDAVESNESVATFVANIFEQYAPFFDQHMAGALQCKIPEIINSDVRAALGGEPSRLDILDLGCGTGICGMLLHDLAGKLVGIDLSPKMVEQTRQRGIYTEVYTGELVSFLRGSSGNFDLVLAADVFVYIADLASIFAEVSRLLRPDGLFAFSLEAGESKVPTPMASGRIVHSLEYMRDLAAAHGLAEVSVVIEELRVKVRGFIVVLRKVDRPEGCLATT